MVTQLLLDTRGPVLRALEAENLRRAGLACRDIAGTGKSARGSARGVDADHGLLDGLDILSLPRQDAQRLRLDHRLLATSAIGDVLDEVRPEHDPIVGNGGGRLRQLDRGVGIVTLTDADRDRFTGKPLLLLGSLETTLLPLRRRQHTFRFPLDIHLGALTETQLPHEASDAVDAHVVGKHVVVGITGMDDRLVHIDAAVPPLLVIAKLVPAKIEEAGVRNRLSGRALAGFQRCQGHERLEGRTRRIGAVQCAVEHRFVWRVVEQIPVVAADAIDKEIGVEGRSGHQRQNASARGLDRHQRAAAVAKGLFGHFLQLDVERQSQVVALYRCCPRQTANGPSARIDFDLFIAGLTMQLIFVLLFQSGLANVVGAFIVCRLFVFLDDLQVALVDSIDIADGVRGDRTQRILAEQTRLDLDTGKEITVGCKASDFLLTQARANRQAFEILALLEQPAKTLAILGQNLDHLAQTFDRRFEVRDLRGRNLQRESRVIMGQDRTIAIDDDTPVGNDRHQGNPIVLGAGGVVGVLQHLQMDEAHDQDNESREHRNPGQGDPEAEARQFAIGGIQR